MLLDLMGVVVESDGELVSWTHCQHRLLLANKAAQQKLQGGQVWSWADHGPGGRQAIQDNERKEGADGAVF